MASMLAGLFGATKSPKSSVRKAQLDVETLENRLVPAVSVNVGNNLIAITSDNASDSVAVRKDYRSIEHHSDGTTVYRDLGLVVTVNGKDTWYACARDNQDMQIIFNGNGGDDTFQNNTSINTIAHGGAGKDYLYGGWGVNYLYGDGDNDILIAGNPINGPAYHQGANYLYGGDANDTLVGSDGADFLYGQAGSDTLIGAAGDDTLSGGTGIDSLYGQAGNDTLDGGDDGVADYLNGGAGADKFQMEGYGTRNNPYTFYFNRDDPADFNPTEDTFYGADQPVYTTVSR